MTITNPVEQVAEAVRIELLTSSFGMAFAPRRLHRPIDDIKDLDSLSVMVFASAMEAEVGNRGGGSQEEHSVDVAFQKRLHGRPDLDPTSRAIPRSTP